MIILFNNQLNLDLPLFNNTIFDVTYDAFTQTPGYDLQTAIEDRRMSRVYRSVTKSSTEWIKFNTASATMRPTYFMLLNTNIASATSIKLQGNNTDAWTSPAVDITIPQNTATRFTTIDGFSQEMRYSYYYDVSSLTSQLKYWRVLINTPVCTTPYDNVAFTYMEIANVWFGGPVGLQGDLIMPGMIPTQEFPVNDNSIYDYSASGQLFGSKGYRYREFSVTFPYVTNSERTQIDNFYEAVQQDKPFVMIPFENDITQEPPMYCQLTDRLRWRKNSTAGLTFSLQMSFREVL